MQRIRDEHGRPHTRDDVARPRPCRPVAVALGLFVLTAVAPADGDYFRTRVGAVNSPRVLVSYALADRNARLTQVDLYYTRDRGLTWTRDETLTGVVNPIPFDAPEEGLYGFFIVLHNAAGASTPPPESGTAPQQWVRVDWTRPSVQALQAQVDTAPDGRHEVYLRWRADDAHLQDRPVSLHYRSLQTRTFQPIAAQQAASSSFRWAVPEDVTGRISLKITALDQAGNRSEYLIEDLEIPAPAKDTTAATNTTSDKRKKLTQRGHDNSQTGTPPLAQIADAAYGEPDAGATAISESAAAQAQLRYDLATKHRLRGEYALAIERYREALELDPKRLSIRHDLAAVLFLQGRHDEAERELGRVLESDPNHAAALKSLALLHATRKNYRSSRNTLNRLLEVNPEDAEAWLYFGDVMMFMGDRAAARASWARAGTIEGAPDEIRHRSDKRLEIYRADRLALERLPEP